MLGAADWLGGERCREVRNDDTSYWQKEIAQTHLGNGYEEVPGMPVDRGEWLQEDVAIRSLKQADTSCQPTPPSCASTIQNEKYLQRVC